MKIRLLKIILGAAMCLVFLVPYCQAEQNDQFKGLDEQIQDIKGDVLDIAVQLKDLEERLLFPSNTQISLFFSIRDNAEFRLDSVDVNVDDLEAVRHLYSYKELDALQHGGAQRLYTGNLTSGTHDFDIVYRGKDRSGDMVERTASFSLSKGVGPIFYEMVLTSDGIILADR